ncbi:PHP domain-containing protein [Treponema pedis]|uniref:PHP domain-containing protein n=1 Tax=Treponema pedis TaxID=409322 RepID=UPI00041239CB|nr:PHP domain-containing protein [Treponema pedis]
MVDLHTHSTASDGTFTPAQLIKAAKKAGLFAIALTDHDILAGLDEAESEAENLNIIFIRGIEISINWQPGEFHLLGLDLRKPSRELDKLLKKLQSERENRNFLIAEKLRGEGFNITYEKVKEFAGGKGGVGRPHFAAYMEAHKMVKNMQKAFDRYLGKHCPCFVEKQNAVFEEAVSAIDSSGGIPVLAHPMSLYLSWAHLPKAIENLKERGLIGIEAWNASTRYNDCKRLEALADKLNMPITAGSDFHGTIRKDRKLGFTSGGIKIENRFYENLRSVHPDLPPLPFDGEI